jgi:photosystem I P700 chlorophyll a apoprotein A2
MKEILDAHRPPRSIRCWSWGYLKRLLTLHMQLGLALASLGVATSLTAQHMYALTPYAFMSKDFTTEAAIHTPSVYCWFLNGWISRCNLLCT